MPELDDWHQPDWNFWAHISTAELWKVVLLSCDAEPVATRRIGRSYGIVGTKGDAPPNYRHPDDFDRRLNIMIAHLSNRDLQAMADGDWFTVAITPITLMAFAGFAVKFGFSLPSGFPLPESVPTVYMVNGQFSAPLRGAASHPGVWALARFADSDVMEHRRMTLGTWSEQNCRSWIALIEKHGLRMMLATWGAHFMAVKDWSPDFDRDLDGAERWARSHPDAFLPFADLFRAYPGTNSPPPAKSVETTPKMGGTVAEPDDGPSGSDVPYEEFPNIGSGHPFYAEHFEPVSLSTFTRDMKTSKIVKSGRQGKPHPINTNHMKRLRAWRSKNERKS